LSDAGAIASATFGTWQAGTLNLLSGSATTFNVAAVSGLVTDLTINVANNGSGSNNAIVFPILLTESKQRPWNHRHRQQRV